MKIDAIAEDVSPLTLAAARAEFDVSTSDQDADLAADVLRRHVTSSHPAAL